MTKEKFLLLKLIEECAEVAQRASKQIQFGTHESQGQSGLSDNKTPETQLTNAQRLKAELTDLYVIVNLLQLNGAIPPTAGGKEFRLAKVKKIAKLNKYLAYSRQLGEIDGEWTI